MPVPLFDTETPLAPLRKALHDKLAEVLDARAYILGPELRAFEEEFAAYLGARHVIGVGNGTDAITIALRALGVAAGDDVVVPSFTFYASVEAIVNAGANPIFCDVDLGTRNVTVETLRRALTAKTTAIVAVDLFGCPAPVPEIRRELGLPVLEDAAQAAGTRLGETVAGALGDVGTFSFYPSKNLGAFGDGGAVVTDDDELAELARALRFHGSRDKQTFTHVGYNSRLDELQAALLRVLLPSLDGWAEARRRVGRRYASGPLAEVVGHPQPPADARPAWHLYVVTHPRADELLAGLAERGIGARAYYRVPVHRQPAMAPYAARTPELPATDELARTNLALPMGPGFSEEQIAEVAEAVVTLAAR